VGGSVIMADAVSLDGFLATDDDQVGPLHDFYFDGGTPIDAGNRHMNFRTSRTSAEYIGEQWRRMHGLWVLERNNRARRFYERAGYVRDGAAHDVTSLGNVTELRYRRPVGRLHPPSTGSEACQLRNRAR